MSLKATSSWALGTVVALAVVLSTVAPALGAPTSAKVSESRAALEAAVTRHQEAQTRSANLDAEISQTFSDLDTATEQAEQAREQLRARVVAVYRSPDSDLAFVLLGASSLNDLVNRWDLMTRIVRQDATALVTLSESRAEAETAARELLELQAREAESLDQLAEEVARAKRELAKSEAALKEFQARTAAAPKAPAAETPAPTRTDERQQLTGSGDWQTGVASHYGRNFSGRGASGAAIGPYSMMVAHKTLPFGTLVEFEYDGKRAVASVEDRGPHVAGRDWDLGPGVVRALGFSGVHEVRFRVID